jgi:sugar lactone lactonase YvrE
VRHLRAEQVTPVCTYHGEGPVWDEAAGVLRFVDMLEGAVLTYDPRTGGVGRRRLGTVAACIRPREHGGLVVALERSLALVDDDVSEPRVLPDVFDDPDVRFNDGGCDPAGRFFVGTMRYDSAQDGGRLYRLAPDGSGTEVLGPVTISNGLSFAPDGRTAHYVDTATQRIDVLDVDPDTGTIAGRRPFVEVPAEAGSPDGIAVDEEGGVWVALWGGSAVRRYGPDGALDVVVEVPARQVSCPAFGGPDRTDLYVTTSREGLEPNDEPEHAGALFRVAAGVRGLPVLPYRG